VLTADGSSTTTAIARPNLTFDGTVLTNFGGINVLYDYGSTTTGMLRLISAGSANYIQSGLQSVTSSAAPLVFGTINGGTEWARFNSSGQFGINCNAPAYTLDVNGNVAANTSIIGGSGYLGNLGVNSASTFPILGFNSSNQAGIYGRKGVNNNYAGLDFVSCINTVSTTVMTISPNDARVGINCNAPQTALDVTGQTRIYEATGSTPSATNGSLIIQHGNNYGQSSIIFPSKINYGSDRGYIIYQDDVSNTSGAERSRLLIGTADDTGGSVTQDATVLEPYGGSVGIGQLNPAYTLDVTGTARITSNLVVGCNISNATATSNTIGGMTLSNSVMTVPTGLFLPWLNGGQSGANPQTYIYAGGASPNQTITRWGDGSGWQYNFLGLSTRTSNVLTLVDNGGVGISCNTPQTALDVNGSGRFVSSSTTSLTVQDTTGSGTFLIRATGEYGELIMNGYLRVNRTGTFAYDSTYANFVVPSDANGSAWFSNGTANFGIGTQSPSYKLDVAGKSRIDTAMIGRWSSYGTTYAGFQHQATVGDVLAYALLQQDDGSTYLNTASGKAISFNVGANNYMKLDQNGKFGIGTGSPAYTLDVNGPARATGNTYLGSPSIVENFSNSSVPTTGGSTWLYALPIQSLVQGTWVWTKGGINYGSTTWNANQNPATAIPASLGYHAYIQCSNATVSSLTRPTTVASGVSCTMSFWWTSRDSYTTFSVTVAYGSQTLATFSSFSTQPPWTLATYTFTTSAANQNIVFTATAPSGTDQSFDVAYFQFIPATYVGINTASPAYTLDVNGSVRGGGVIMNNSVISSPAATDLQITTPAGYNLTINPVNQLIMSGNAVSLTSSTNTTLNIATGCNWIFNNSTVQVLNIAASGNISNATATSNRIGGVILSNGRVSAALANTGIAPVSALAVVNGQGTPGLAQIELQYYSGGGYTHYISSRHTSASGGALPGNAIDFWLYSNTVDAQTSSTAPGTCNVNIMSVTAAGVGIGTSSPGYTLDVNGTARVITNGTVSTSTWAGYNYGTDTLAIMTNTATGANSNGVASILFGTSTQTNFPYGRIATIDQQVGTGGYQSAMVFQTNGGGVSLAERMRIASNGYVGINCNAPAYTLDVSGTTRSAKFLGTLSNTGAIAPVSPYAALNGGAYNINIPQIEFQYSTGGTTHFIGSRHNQGGVGNLYNAIDFWLYSSSGGNGASTTPGTGNINIMSVTAAGVGIGTSTPTQLLDVGGTIRVYNATYDVMGLFSPTYGNYIHIGAWNQAGDTSKNIVLNQYGGRVGIGTNSPGSTLTVAGDAYISGPTVVNDNLYIGGNGYAQHFFGHAGRSAGRSPISPFAAQNGNDGGGGPNAQIEFQYYGGGGYNQYITSRHAGNLASYWQNAIDFWLYSATSGDGAASSQPGTGNVNMMSVTAGGVGINCNAPAYTLDVSGTTRTKYVIGTGATGYGARTPISPFAAINGNGSGRSQMEFQYWEGGYNHFITSEHNGSGASGNSLSFWIYDYSVPGGGGSSAPGTGNYNTMTIKSDSVAFNGDIYLSNHILYSVRQETFTYGGNIASANVSGINYLDINAPPNTGSGTGRLRIVGNNGRLDFDDNVILAGNGSNNIGMFNQYGYVQIASDQNVYLGGGGSHTVGEDQIRVHGLIYSDSRIFTGAAGEGFYHANGSAFIKTRCDNGSYGGLSMNGYFQVCINGTSNVVFNVPADTDGAAWYSNGTGRFGIGTTTPSKKLEVVGEVGISGYLTLYGAGTSPLYMNGNTTYQQGGIIDLGATSSNNAYISGLNHIYGQPSGTGSSFGGLVIDYMGGQFYNGGGNNGGIYCDSSHTLFMYNVNGDILIDSHTYGVNVYGAGVNINPTISFHSNVYRDLSSTAIQQPVIQYGTATGSGASGSVTVTLPTAYTSATSYVAFASMMDTVECKISVNRNSASSITIYWSQAGSGTQTLGWNTMGT